MAFVWSDISQLNVDQFSNNFNEQEKDKKNKKIFKNLSNSFIKLILPSYRSNTKLIEFQSNAHSSFVCSCKMLHFGMIIQ